MMMGFYDGYGMGLFGPLMMIFFWALIIGCSIWLLGLLFPAMRTQHHEGNNTSFSAQEILKMRFAKGELTADDYIKMSKLVDQ